MRRTRRYHVRMVHRIDPKDTDVSSVELDADATPTRESVLKALKKAGLHSGRIREFRQKGDEIIVFPPDECGNWWSLTLTPEKRPTTVDKDLARRGLDAGYLDRMALSPFLLAGGSKSDPVWAYMTTGEVPEQARAYLRTVAEKASTWTDPEVQAAGLALAIAAVADENNAGGVA